MESTKKSARKKARESALHTQRVAPLLFLVNVVTSSQGEFNVTDVNEPFGKNKEAYVRECYHEDITVEIFDIWKNHMETWGEDNKRTNLFVITGSSGIGKSTFLAYWISHMHKCFGNIAIC